MMLRIWIWTEVRWAHAWWRSCQVSKITFTKKDKLSVELKSEITSKKKKQSSWTMLNKKLFWKLKIIYVFIECLESNWNWEFAFVSDLLVMKCIDFTPLFYNKYKYMSPKVLNIAARFHHVWALYASRIKWAGFSEFFVHVYQIRLIVIHAIWHFKSSVFIQK